MSRRMRTRGFTLIEMLIVMTLIGVVSAFSVPRVANTLRREAARSARREIATQVMRARNAAAQRGCRATLHINSSSDRVWVTVCKTTGTGVDTIGTITDVATRYKVNMIATADSLPFAANSLGLGTATIAVAFARGTYWVTMAITPVGRATW